MLIMSGSEWYHGMLSDQSFSLRGPGCSFITHSFLLKGEELPMYVGCDELLTYEHILLTCSDFIEIRESHFTAQSQRVLFQEILPEKIFLLFEINQYFWKNLNLRSLLVMFVSYFPFKYGFKIVHIPVLTRIHFKKVI